MSTRTRASWCGRLGLGLAFGVVFVGCKDSGRQSAEEAKTNVDLLVALADKDVGEVERGLPEGGKKMAVHLAGEKDLSQNVPAVRNALQKIRREVIDLGVAKSTFFAFTDDKGIAICNNWTPDAMAGKDVLRPYPAFRSVLGGEAFVSTTGEFGTPNPVGPDREWAAAVPVKRADGALLGMLVTGWTYRLFANHLHESLKRDLQERLMSAGDKGKLPVLYVCLYDARATYCSRDTPPVNEKTLTDLKLTERTATTKADGAMVITDRKFGWAAARVSKLGDGVGVVVLRSEI